MSVEIRSILVFAVASNSQRQRLRSDERRRRSQDPRVGSDCTPLPRAVKDWSNSKKAAVSCRRRGRPVGASCQWTPHSLPTLGEHQSRHRRPAQRSRRLGLLPANRHVSRSSMRSTGCWAMPSRTYPAQLRGPDERVKCTYLHGQLHPAFVGVHPAARGPFSTSLPACA